MYKFEWTLLLVVFLNFVLADAAPENTNITNGNGESWIGTLDDQGRRLINNITTTGPQGGPNVDVNGLAIIGATLMAIALALAAGGLLPGLAGLLGGGGGGDYGGGYGGGYMRRSAADDGPRTSATNGSHSWLRVLTLLDQASPFDVADLECQKKVVCELHRNGPAVISGRDLRVLSDKIFDVFNYLTPAADDSSVGGGTHSLLADLLNAAKRGKAKQDCDELYNACHFSVGKLIKPSNDDDDDDDNDTST